MNLFRSEEYVKNWPHYDAVSAESVMPLSDWARVFRGPLHKRRLDPDYLSRVHEYESEMFVSLKKMGKTGPFWTPE